MEDVIRPGPLSIDPGVAPGGVVIHIYGVPSGRLLTDSTVTNPAHVQAIAEADADRANVNADDDDDGLCLVAYDGDTGERMEWPGYATGDRV